ncbi:MAG: M28 family peptidase [Bacteroidota bacterium]
MKTKSGWLLTLLAMAWLAVACGDSAPTTQSPTLPEIKVPAAVGDSAYAFVVKQVEFGPRVPNTEPHTACADWMVQKLASYGAEVQVQKATLQAFDGSPVNARNIIARFEPKKPKRVLLSAHWDTRPIADQDTVRRDEPIPGANDGGSGVAVLLEMARVMQAHRPNVGIDIIFWDAEDNGRSEVPNSYCLGTQHWARNPHTANYRPIYGINLDMVGAPNAYFPQEATSLKYAPEVLKDVWQTARRLGHDRYFKTHRSAAITDDHLYVNEIARIPMINIIDQPNGEGFFEHWHTHQDDLDAVSPRTLHAVAETLLEVVYRE